MADLTIIHTHEQGTLIDGSTKGDGVWEIVRQRQHGGWRSSRLVGLYVRGSRDRNADQWRINAAKTALEAAGHTVTVTIDNTPRPTAQVEADRADRSEARVERLDDRASRADGRAEAAEARVNAIADHIPLGQPILIGHHSERRARKDQDRIMKGTRKAIGERDYSRELSRRAQAAESNQRHRDNPRATMRRIEKLQADARDVDRHLAGFRNNRGDEFTAPDEGSQYHANLTARAAHLAEQITYWQGQLDELAAAGEFVAWGPEHFVKGDAARYIGTWYPVTRVNKKSVSIEVPGWSGIRTAPWDEITGRRRDGMQLDTPNGQPWPVELARKITRWGDLLGSADARSSLGRNDPGRMVADYVRWAQRLVHGLPLDAGDPEVAAFQPDDDDTQGRRTLAAACYDMFKRLEAGEKSPDILAAGPTWTGTRPPTWRMPTTEPVEQQIRDLKRGDIVHGLYDTGSYARLYRSWCGPVEAVIPHTGDEYSGERFIGYWGIQLAGQVVRQLKPFHWVAVHPAAPPALAAELVADASATGDADDFTARRATQPDTRPAPAAEPDDPDRQRRAILVRYLERITSLTQAQATAAVDRLAAAGHTGEALNREVAMSVFSHPSPDPDSATARWYSVSTAHRGNATILDAERAVLGLGAPGTGGPCVLDAIRDDPRPYEDLCSAFLAAYEALTAQEVTDPPTPDPAPADEPDGDDPRARWRALCKISPSGATGDAGHRAGIIHRAVRRVHQLPDDAADREVLAHRHADHRGWDYYAAAYLAAYDAITAEDSTPAPRPCRKARQRPIPFDCKLDADHDGDCQLYTLPPGPLDTATSVDTTGPGDDTETLFDLADWGL